MRLISRKTPCVSENWLRPTSGCRMPTSPTIITIIVYTPSITIFMTRLAWVTFFFKITWITTSPVESPIAARELFQIICHSMHNNFFFWHAINSGQQSMPHNNILYIKYIYLVAKYDLTISIYYTTVLYILLLYSTTTIALYSTLYYSIV